MSLIELFQLIGAPPANPPASQAHIFAAETRLGGRLPDTLRHWFQEADGFSGQAKTCMWRFKSLERLHTISEVFPAAEHIVISRQDHPAREMPGNQYVIFCDAQINLPFYAVNICTDSSYFSEVVFANEETPTQAVFVASSFERFAELLFQHPDDAPLLPKD
jgi:hypothetical protein